MSEHRSSKHATSTSLVATIAVLVAAAASARTSLDRGMNLFSEAQDVEMGREAAQEAERELRLLKDPALEDYVTEVGQRVAAVSTGPGFPYRFRIVDSADINAFALPGGFIYIHKGVLQAAEDESELAGVLAHEVGHVAMRHGTNQLSKQVLVQAPLALFLGSAMKDEGSWKATLARLGIQAGLSAVFLKYSRQAETQADILATQQLFDAGYDPEGMARFFAAMEAKARREPSRLAGLFASHPVPADRRQRVEQEIAALGRAPAAPALRTAGFRRMKARLEGYPAVAQDRDRDRWPGERGGRAGLPEVPAPGRRLESFEDPRGRWHLEMPASFDAVVAEHADQVTLAPRAAHAGSVLTHGVVVRIDRAQATRRQSLAAALDETVAALARSNPYLREVEGERWRGRIGGRRAVETSLRGRLRQDGFDYQERVGVHVVALGRGEHAVIVTIAPEAALSRLAPVYEDMLASLEFADRPRDGSEWPRARALR